MKADLRRTGLKEDRRRRPGKAGWRNSWPVKKKTENEINNKNAPPETHPMT